MHPPKQIVTHCDSEPFTETVLVSFGTGMADSAATLDAVNGHRLIVHAYTVQWTLPKDQTGEIGVASPPDNPGQDFGGTELYADPGAPLRISAVRTRPDGIGYAIITFTGVETAVPREAVNPVGQ